jgi:class 3 adenylate cyclase
MVVQSINSYENLRSLLRERNNKKGEALQAVDTRIADIFNDVRSVLFIDLKGFSKNIQQHGILNALNMMITSRELFSHIIKQHYGIVVKTEGDSVLALFQKPEKALMAAISIRERSLEYNRMHHASQSIVPCIGICHGEVMLVGDDVYGQTVNLACKLGEDIAQAYEILVTSIVQSILTGIAFEEVPHSLPVHESVYRLL